MTRGVRLRRVSRKQDSKETKLSRRSMSMFTPLPRSLSRGSPARHNVAFLLPFAASVRPPRQAVGTAARTPSVVRAGLFSTSEKGPLVRPGPFVAAVYVFIAAVTMAVS